MIKGVIILDMSRKNRGLKQHDIAVIGAILSSPDWPSQKEISLKLDISQAEVSYSFGTLERIGLINAETKKLYKTAIKELIVHGIKYFFPIEESGIGRGYPTGPSSPFFKNKVHSDNTYVWAHEDGNQRGIITNSIIHKVPISVIDDDKLYLFLSVIDVYRGLGGVRHLKEAEKYLERLLK